MLSPKGHVEHALHLVDDGETTWITVEPGTASALVAWLESMRFMLRVEVADVTADWAVLGEPLGVGVGARRAARLGRPVARAGRRHRGLRAGRGAPGRGSRLARAASCRAAELEAARRRPAARRHLGRRGAAGRRLAAAARASRPTTAPSRTRSTGCAPPCTCTRAATAARRRSPGCTTSGRPPRRLVFLHLDGSGHVLPEAGSPVLLGEREVGRLTSVARHHEDGPVALAVIKRSVAERRGSSRRRHLGRADRRRERLSAADPAVCSCHDGAHGSRRTCRRRSAGTLITVAPTGAEHAKADLPQLPTTLEELVETARRCEAAGASLIHLHIRDGEHRPTLDAGRLRAAVDAVRVVDRPRGAAVDRRVGARPARAAAHRARRRARLVLADLRHDQLRRRRVPQPLGVHERPVRAGAGARGGARVRAVRPRPRARAAPAARHPRAAVRRPGARRLRDRGARRDAGHDRPR